MDGVRGKLRNRTGGIFLARIAIMLVLALSAFADTPVDPNTIGSISGVVVDALSGEPLIGVSVAVQGTQLGAVTDLDGHFLIRAVPAGSYVLAVSSIGFATVTVTDAAVVGRQELKLSLKLTSKTTDLQKEIKVTAKALRNTEASMLKHRQQSNSVTDAISSETIQRSGSGDAAEAMSKVVGATVMDGKYVFVRGLGDRYANTQLNGSLLPSPDPEKQAVPMDLISTNLLDNIIVTKSFTPDKPGNFSGGSVDLVTKDFPETQALSIATSRGYNSLATGDSKFMTFDDSQLDIPAEWNTARAKSLGNSGQSFFKTRDSAEYISNLSKTFGPDMDVTRKKAPIDQSYSLSYGNSLLVLGRNLGINASANYGRNYRFYDDGVDARYFLTTTGATVPVLASYLHDSKGTEEENYGGLINLVYSLHSNHKLGVSYIRNNSNELESRHLEGGSPDQMNLQAEDTITARLEAFALDYSERDLNSLQFKGEHQLNLLFPFRARWQTSFSRSGQNTVARYYDQKVIYYEDRENQETGDIETVKLDTPIYKIDATDVEINPTRYFRDISEDNDEYALNLTMPLSGKTTFKTGFNYLTKTRDHAERRFVYRRESEVPGDPDAYHNSIGYDSLVQGTTTLYIMKNSIYEYTTPDAQYSGTQEILGTYGMFDVPLTSHLTLITGARYETTKMNTHNGYAPINSSYKEGSIDRKDWLPSVNLIYSLSDNMKVRGAYGKTMARPTLREFAPYASEDFGGSGKLFNGNPNLNRTLIDNYDLRWEWYARPGEIIAVSGFYKKFKDPIEVVIIGTQANNLIPQNVDRATVYGVEFEFRKRLDQIHPALSNFDLEANLTLVSSSVDEPADELLHNRAVNPGAPDHRPMFGQAPHVVNVAFGYTNRLGTALNFNYNLVGERFAFNSTNGMADVYERERGTIDIVGGQRIWRGLQFKFAAKNLTDSRVRQTYKLQDVEYAFREYGSGRTISAGFNYKFD